MASDDLRARIDAVVQRGLAFEAADGDSVPIEITNGVLALVQPELDQLRAGIPLICSDERHEAKVAALETALAEWRAAAYKATAERDHLASACRDMRRRLTVLGAALPPGMEFYVGKIKAMRVFLANAVADIPDNQPATEEEIQS